MVFETVVSVGAEKIKVTHEDQKEFLKVVHSLHEMDQRVTADAIIRYRKPNDEYDQFEFYSPYLRAAKKISEFTRQKAAVKDAPLLIKYDTPWVRFEWDEKKGSQQLVMWDYVPKNIAEAGFTERMTWYRGHYDDKAESWVLDDPKWSESQADREAREKKQRRAYVED
jgi:hypothetical protein